MSGGLLNGAILGSLGIIVGVCAMYTVDHYIVRPVKDAIHSVVHKLHPTAAEKVGVQRGLLFADFSKAAEWPAADAAAMRQGIEKGKAKVFTEVQQKRSWTTAELDAYGAQAWGIMAAGGVNAYDSLRDNQGKLLRESGAVLVLTSQFLSKRCEQKLEVACLDLAKNRASAFSDRVYSAQEDVDRDALAAIPNWLKTAQANELRERIKNQGGFWRYIEKKVR